MKNLVQIILVSILIGYGCLAIWYKQQMSDSEFVDGVDGYIFDLNEEFKSDPGLSRAFDEWVEQGGFGISAEKNKPVNTSPDMLTKPSVDQ